MEYILQLNFQEEGRIAILSFNRPDKLNAINEDVLKELRKHLEELAQHERLKLLIIQSELSKAFCSGIDVAYVQTLTNDQMVAFFTELAAILEMIIHFPCTTMAIVQGYAFGVGADIALSCDLRIGSNSAKFRFPGPQFGLLLGTQRLIHEVGPSKARAITLMNKILDAQTALHDGILHMVYEDEQIMRQAYIHANRLLDVPNSSLSQIRTLCSQTGYEKHKDKSSIQLTQESVLDENFKSNFDKYVQKLQCQKKE